MDDLCYLCAIIAPPHIHNNQACAIQVCNNQACAIQVCPTEPFYPLPTSPNWTDESELNWENLIPSEMEMKTDAELAAHFTASAPVRRVERSELASWLQEIGRRTFMDDLEHEDHLQQLWDEMRFRNSKLLAGLTHAQLDEAGYAAGEVATILQYVQNGPPPEGPQVVSVTMQPDPNADARSQAQLDAFERSMTDMLSDSRDRMREQAKEASADKSVLLPFLDGETRRPTVAETRKLVLDIRAKAAKYDPKAADVYQELYHDPEVDLAPLLVGLNTVDTKMYADIYKILTPAQYSRYGGGETSSGAKLAKNILSSSINMDHRLYMTLCAKVTTFGRTAMEHAVPARLKAYETAITEVRYRAGFGLDSAVDALMKVMSPMPEAAVRLQGQWMIGAKTQQAYDELLIAASTEAEAAPSASTKNTPTANPRRRQFERGLQQAEGPDRRTSFNSRRQLDSGSQRPSRYQPPFARQTDANSTAAARNPQYERKRAYPSVNAINRDSDATLEQENAELKHQIQQLECNLVEMQYQAGLISDADLEGEQLHCGFSKALRRVVLPKGMKARIRQRAPTEDKRMQKALMSDSLPGKVAPAIDSCTYISVVSTRDLVKCRDVRQTDPVVVGTVTGSEMNTTADDMPLAVVGDVPARHMKGAKQSVVAQVDLLEKGYGIITMPDHGCALIDTNKSDDDPTKFIECPPHGNFFKMPLEEQPAKRAIEMQRAERVFRQFVQRRRINQMLEHARTHMPADMVNCDDCIQSGIAKAPSKRLDPERHRSESFDGIDLSYDYITGLPTDNDGNTVAFHMECRQYDLGYILPQKSRSQDDAVEAFKECIQHIFRMLPVDKRKVRTAHSDNEKSFVFGKLGQYIRDNHWHCT